MSIIFSVIGISKHPTLHWHIIIALVSMHIAHKNFPHGNKSPPNTIATSQGIPTLVCIRNNYTMVTAIFQNYRKTFYICEGLIQWASGWSTTKLYRGIGDATIQQVWLSHSMYWLTCRLQFHRISMYFWSVNAKNVWMPKKESVPK